MSISKKQKQLQLIKRHSTSYGGDLLKTRKGRSRGRPLDTKNTMHLVLRSSKAKGPWSFRSPKHQKAIDQIIAKFSEKYGIKVISMANVGNHIHLQIKLGNLYTYRPFIRAITSSIAMAVTGVSRWTNGDGTKKLKAKDLQKNSMAKQDDQNPGRDLDSSKQQSSKQSSDWTQVFKVGIVGFEAPVKLKKLKFWDHRPFTRVVQGFKALLTLKDYILLNELEGFGVKRAEARFVVFGDGGIFTKALLKPT